MKIAGGGAGGNVYTRGPTDTDKKYENGFLISFVEFYQINVILFSLSVTVCQVSSSLLGQWKVGNYIYTHIILVP